MVFILFSSLGESWLCKIDMFWLLHHLPKDSTTFKVMDSSRMICGGYKYKGKPAISILRILSVCYIIKCYTLLITCNYRYS